MTEDELPFKVGDVVWFVTRFNTQRCTVTSFNKLKFEPYDIATISVETEDDRTSVLSARKVTP